MKKNKLLTTSSEWTFDLIEKAWPIIDKLGQEYGWKGFEPQIEIVSSEQMLDRCASVGMPISYPHWSYGKSRILDEENYSTGKSSLAYEMIINSNPALCYLMEDNTACMQLLTMCHAAVGHSHFFKHNYLFKEWTSPDSIIDYLVFARNYIKECEEKYGEKEVSDLLDRAHSLKLHSVDKYHKPKKLSLQKEKQRIKAKLEQERLDVNVLDKVEPMDSIIRKRFKELKLEFSSLLANGNWKMWLNEIPKEDRLPLIPEENLLYFIEKHSPSLRNWQKEILRIVRKIEQYFYPQRQTKVMNEGFASFVHYELMTQLHERGYINDGFFIEFLKSHTSVIRQLPWNSKKYYGVNPYALGFAMFKDIKRICTNPTEEDKKWFPNLIGKNWIEEINYAVQNFNDESFILQYLSPKVIRDYKLFALDFKTKNDYFAVTGIHDDNDYKHIKSKLSKQYEVSRGLPNIEVFQVYPKTRELSLMHHFRDKNLDSESSLLMLENIYRLWGFPIVLFEVEGDFIIEDHIIAYPESHF